MGNYLRAIALIHFRCWFCNKRYNLPEHRIGERLTCTCQRLVRVPRYDNGDCRARTLTDWLVETIMYGGGGGLLGLGLGVLILSRIRIFAGDRYLASIGFILGCTILGFLAGLFGERGVNWLGRIIRRHEE